MKRLTTEQQKLVEQNHNLIYDFAKRKNLNIDEYYDILAIALCKAAQTYNNKKGEFSTIANTCMNNDLVTYYRHINKIGSISEELIISGDKEVNNGENVIVFDTIADNFNLSNEVIDSLSVLHLMNLLTDKEKLVADCIINGLKQKEIAKKLNCTQQNIYHIIIRIRKKFEKHINN